MAADKLGETTFLPPGSANTTATNIPFKHEPQSFAEQSLSTFLITVVLLGAVVAGLYYFRNALQKKTGLPLIKASSIQLKERVRLSPKLTMYVVTYRDKEILIAQSGDHIAPITEFVGGTPSVLTSDHPPRQVN